MKLPPVYLLILIVSIVLASGPVDVLAAGTISAPTIRGDWEWVMPTQPPAMNVRLVGQSRGYSWAVAVQGNYAYIAGAVEGDQEIEGALVIVNITDPTMPQEVGSYETPGYARAVAVSGDYAYVADMGRGLVIVNVIDPSAHGRSVRMEGT